MWGEWEGVAELKEFLIGFLGTAFGAGVTLLVTYINRLNPDPLQTIRNDQNSRLIT